MFVDAMMWSRKARGSVMAVFTATLFSHSNSAHMERNCGHGAGVRVGQAEVVRVGLELGRGKETHMHDSEHCTAWRGPSSCNTSQVHHTRPGISCPPAQPRALACTSGQVAGTM